MLKKQGFTLMELLIAATIISILLVFATVQYRNSAAETRWNQAKSRLDQLANAVQRAELDYDGIVIQGQMHNSDSPTSCTLNQPGNDPYKLIGCGYLENGMWSDPYFAYYACRGAGDSSTCKNNALACVRGIVGSKLPSAYQSYMYCVWPDDVREYN